MSVLYCFKLRIYGGRLGMVVTFGYLCTNIKHICFEVENMYFFWTVGFAAKLINIQNKSNKTFDTSVNVTNMHNCLLFYLYIIIIIIIKPIQQVWKRLTCIIVCYLSFYCLLFFVYLLQHMFDVLEWKFFSVIFKKIKYENMKVLSKFDKKCMYIFF